MLPKTRRIEPRPYRCLFFTEPPPYGALGAALGPLGPDESCVFAVRFWPSDQFFGLKQDQRLLATATDPLTGWVLDSDTFAFLGRAA
jgi:hypothetical protein